MTSLADLFNPTFLMFLGILVLVIALLVVYFESKMREQNHKIASMLSLVSTLADDMNGLKMGLNHLALASVQGGNHSIPQNTPFPTHNLGSIHHNEKSNELIEVSDDDEEDDDEDDDEDEENEEEEWVVSVKLEDINDIDESSYGSNDEDDDKDHTTICEDDNIKVIKLNISQGESDSEENAFDLDAADDLAELDGEFEPTDDIPEISEEYTEEILNLKYDESKEEKPLAEDHLVLEEQKIPAIVYDLKTISINLGDEHHSEHIDFKKLQLPKLRSIVVEKGLASNSEASKLKKHELLKLLGAE
jgi:hypothetical protein